MRPMRMSAQSPTKLQVTPFRMEENVTVKITIAKTRQLNHNQRMQPSRDVVRPILAFVNFTVNSYNKVMTENNTDHDPHFVRKIVQPGLLGLMDGSVSTLAPLFAAAFATHDPHVAFLIGTSAATGAGISMAFAEGLSDDGILTGRGHPFMRGLITGGMTFFGGIFHTLPFLSGNFNQALFWAYLIVGVELYAIAFIRYRYMKMNFWLSILQVVVGGALVFIAGYLIGSS